MAFFFSQPLFWIAYFSFYISLCPSSNVHVWVRLSRTDTCPISPYPKWLGVVVKAEEHGSVRCRVFNGSNGSFPFVLYRHTVQGSFFYQRRYFRFFLKLFLYRSYPLSLDFYYTFSAIPLLGSGLGSQCKNGPGSQIIGPHNQ